MVFSRVLGAFWVGILSSVLLLGSLQAGTKKYYFDELESFSSDFTYKIKLKDGSLLKLKGEDLRKENQGIRLSDDRFYSLEEIQKIRGRSNHRVGRHAGKGALFGAAGLAVLTGAAGVIAADRICDWITDEAASAGATVNECNKTNKTLAVLAATGTGALVGAGLGALVGVLIPRYEKVKVIPTYRDRRGRLSTGLTLSMDF
ncbi:MAG: hypothetical protein KDK66_03180 [Deltaproteobacteria bacterium]|nr:hypothetical protein [Deltaproteobacteria bacterium]